MPLKNGYFEIEKLIVAKLRKNMHCNYTKYSFQAKKKPILKTIYILSCT